LTAIKAIGSSELSLAISDPIAKRRTVLPTPPSIFVPADNKYNIASLTNLASSTKIVSAVDYNTGSYKVFLLNNHDRIPTMSTLPRMYVHDSSTSEWRPLQNLPDGVAGSWASSAMVLHDSVFILKQHNDRLSLFRYRFVDETWMEPYHMYFPRFLDECHLVVRGDCLFLSARLRCFKGESRQSCCEIYKVLVGETRTKLVAQFTEAQLQQIFGGIDDVRWNGIPSVGSDGICSSVILGSNRGYIGFWLRRYDLATGLVEALPQHPTMKQSPVFPGNYYAGNVEDMKLSLRDLLAPAPEEQTSMGLQR
jgi:hypothetical protein